MEILEKLEKFAEPLSYIKDEKIKEFAEKGIAKIPDYFFVIPASSTGKYHPEYSLGEGGLLRHTISAIRFARTLFTITHSLTLEQRDLIIVSLIFHDARKSGLEIQEKYSRIDHPLLAAKALEEDEDLKGILTDEQLKFVLDNIRTHMGQWNKDFDNNPVMDMPSNRYQHFVHMCDYLASRKYLIMDFAMPIVD